MHNGINLILSYPFKTLSILNICLYINFVRCTVIPIWIQAGGTIKIHKFTDTDALVALLTHIHTHTHTNLLRRSSISVCVQAFHYSLSAFIFPIGCPICFTTGNINRPTIVFKEINTVEYCPCHFLCLSLSLSLSLSFSSDLWSFFYIELLWHKLCMLLLPQTQN